jgi:hypothetical protein
MKISTYLSQKYQIDTKNINFNSLKNSNVSIIQDSISNNHLISENIKSTSLYVLTNLDKNLRKPSFVVPSNLELAKKIKDDKYLMKHEKEGWLKHRWKLYYMIWRVYIGRWCNDEESELGIYNYVPICIKLLEEIVGSDYASNGLGLLVRWGILEASSGYRKGKDGVDGECRGFRLKEPYFSARFKAVHDIDYGDVSHLLWDKSSQKQLHLPEHDFLEENLRKLSFDLNVYAFLYEMETNAEQEFKLFKKTIGKKVAEFQDGKAFIDVEVIGKNLIKDYKARMRYKIDYYTMCVTFIDELQHFFLEVDPITGRVFTNLTSLPRELRPYLRYEGKSLVEIDISNAQPLLLIGDYPKDEPERADFCKVVESGTFYEELDKPLKKPFGMQKRDLLKKAVYIQIFFGRIYRNDKGEKIGLIAKAFAQQFPALDKIIDGIKENDYRALSRILQTREAKIMISRVIGRIMRDSPFFVQTIHDSLLLLPENVEGAKEIMIEEFQKELGVTPNIKTKGYGPTLSGNDLKKDSEEDRKVLEIKTNTEK